MHGDVARKAHSDYFLGGGRGSGKSSFVSVETLLTLFRDPEISAVVIRKTASSLRSSVFEQLLWAMDRLGVSRMFDPKVSLQEITCLPTGQQILLRGADDPVKLKSIRPAKGHFGVLWFEEAGEFGGPEAIRSIRASVIRGGDCVTFYTFNPPRSAGAWINAEARRAVAGRLYHESDYRSMPREWLGEGFIRDAEALKETNPKEYAHMYLGSPVGSDAQVFCNVAAREIPDGELRGFDRFLAGLDFGFASDPDAFVVAHYDAKKNELFIVDEFYAYHDDARTLVSEVKKRTKGLTVVCDSSEPRLISELAAAGVSARAARKGAGSVERGIRFLRELRQIVIDPSRAPNACREFTSYEYPVSGDGRVIPALRDRDNHTIDALRYALEGAVNNGRAKTLRRDGLAI